MGTLCGWITHDQPAADVLAVVRGMLPGCSESDVASRASGVVAARPDVIPATATESNGLLIAIGGRVRGTDAAKLADQLLTSEHIDEAGT